MRDLTTRRAFLKGAAGAAIGVIGGTTLAEAADAGRPFPFYAMDTGLRGPDVPTLADKVRLLKRLGYWGIDYTLDHDELPRLMELLADAGLQLACVYLSPAIEDQPDVRLAESIKRMKGLSTRIELAIRSARFKPSDPAGDGAALELVRRVSDMAADSGPLVSIYPHTGLWTERVQDGVRLAEKSGRKNVGTNFNLVHWKWVRQNQPLEQTLRQSLPHLFVVTVNGLAGNSIVPLDEGNYDVGSFMQTVRKVGYRGRVGLQGYGISGPSERHLSRSMRQWKRILQEIGEDR